MPNFACPTIRIGAVTKHANADTLSITEVDGQPVIFKTGDFQEGDLAVYVPIEAVIKKDSPGGAAMPWLKYNAHGLARIKAVRLRQVFSMGVLIKPPKFKKYPAHVLLELEATGGFFATAEEMATWEEVDPPEGTDAAAALEIVKYEEPEHGISFRGPDENAPTGFEMGSYDVEPFRKYQRLFDPEEYVIVTEKIHGCNSRFAFFDGKLWVGSHNRWKKRPETPEEMEANNNIWWKAATQKGADWGPIILGDPKDPLSPKAESLEEKLQHPEAAQKLGFYGEVYGRVQDLKYGLGGVRVAFFDIKNLITGEYLDPPERMAVLAALKLEGAPVLFTGKFKDLKALELAEGLTEVNEQAAAAGHMREGLVVEPMKGRRDPHIGRVKLKLVSQQYLLRKDGTEAH